MAQLLSAVDAVSPAFETTRKLLFQPFRFRKWARLAVITLLSGELGGGGGNGGTNFSFPAPSDSDKDLVSSFVAAQPFDWLLQNLVWVAVIVAAGVGLALVLLYVNSIFRFLLLDAVLFDRYELGEGWRRWQTQGASYFYWQLCLSVAVMGTLGLAVGLPVYYAWRADVFKNPGEHLGLLIGGGILLFFVLIGIVIAGAVIALFARDFVVPLMALENIGVLESWGRVRPMLSAEKWSYTGYLGMKIVLAIAAAIVFGILNLVALLVLLIPLFLVGLVVGVGGAAAGLTWNVVTITAAVVAGGIALALVLYVMGFVTTPSAVFFQSYALHFFGGRYPALGERLHPPAPPAPPVAPEPQPAA